MFFRKHILPWTASDCFRSEAEFQTWLQKKVTFFTNLRIFFLAIAAVCLLPGYILDQRPLMLLTIAPLALVLLVSIALDQIEKRLDGQNKTE